MTTEIFGDVLVAHTPEELTDETIPAVQNTIEEAVTAGRCKIVLQMDRSDAFDSAGLTALFDMQDQLRSEGGRLAICGLRDHGQKVFEITRMDRWLDLYDSVTDAVSSFRQTLPTSRN